MPDAFGGDHEFGLRSDFGKHAGPEIRALGESNGCREYACVDHLQQVFIDQALVGSLNQDFGLALLLQ